jgi:hypothetical protein
VRRGVDLGYLGNPAEALTFAHTKFPPSLARERATSSTRTVSPNRIVPTMGVDDRLSAPESEGDCLAFGDGNLQNENSNL